MMQCIGVPGVPGLGLGGGNQAALITPSLPSSNPNLLLFPEDFTNVVWIKPAVTVTANYGDVVHPTADQLVMPTPRQCVQNSATAGTAGSATANITITSSWVRYSVTAMIDGLSYTYSEELILLSGNADLRLTAGAAGGVIQVILANQSGVTSTFGAYGAKLEQAASFSGYP